MVDTEVQHDLLPWLLVIANVAVCYLLFADRSTLMYKAVGSGAFVRLL
jgi:hypothetical protein